MANNNLLAGVYAGLTNTYSYLASQYPNGLTLENLTEARTKTTNVGVLNQTFASYLQNNFKKKKKRCIFCTVQKMISLPFVKFPPEKR